MTFRAPISATALAGTGLTTPPSTSVYGPIRIAGYTPGIDMLAIRAGAISPWRKMTST